MNVCVARMSRLRSTNETNERTTEKAMMMAKKVDIQQYECKTKYINYQNNKVACALDERVGEQGSTLQYERREKKVWKKIHRCLMYVHTYAMAFSLGSFNFVLFILKNVNSPLKRFAISEGGKSRACKWERYGVAGERNMMAHFSLSF